MIRNGDFIGSLEKNPYKFRHYDISDFPLFVNGERVPTEDLSLDMDHETASFMGYRTLFEGCGIHHSNSGLQITHGMYINGYCIHLFDLPPDLGATYGHTSHAENGNIRVLLKFNKPFPEAITCVLYLEYNNSAFVDFSHNITTDF